jgi:biopolymer transport protein ExbD
MSHKKKKHGSSDVEVNITAMLDMAFQLLSFFILTFKPAPVEGQISLRLPPPLAVNNPNAPKKAGQDTSSSDAPKGVDTLTVSVVSQGGGAPSYAVGERPVFTIAALENELGKIFSDKGNPFEQVIVQVGSEVMYESLMKVVEACAKQKLPDGSKLSKLSLVEIPSR